MTITASWPWLVLTVIWFAIAFCLIATFEDAADDFGCLGAAAVALSVVGLLFLGLWSSAHI